MNNNKSKKNYITNDLYVLAFVILGVIMLFTDLYWIGIVQLALSVVILAINLILRYFSGKKIADMIEKVTLSANNSNDSLLSFPLPIVLLDSKSSVIWYNADFKDLFPDENLNECAFSDLFENFELALLGADNKSGAIFELKHNDKTYKVISNTPQKMAESGEAITLLYLEDITSITELREKYVAEKVFACFVSVDNYDELMDSTPSASVPQLQAEIYKTINDWAEENEGILLKYEKDKYFILFEYKRLEGFIKNKFEVLSKVREINTKNTIPTSISIGIGLNGKTLSENDDFAKDALNMALGRGGDQAVIKDAEQFRFYGSATKELEKSTRVKARVVSHALSGLINSADNVVVLTHKNADIDGVGAAFGLLRICRIHNTPLSIAMETYDKTVANVLAKIDNSEDYAGLVISNEEARFKITPNTLIILVDTHKSSLIEDPSLLENAKQLVVIDHHRRTTGFVDHPSLVYHEPYASSTCEMITEILQYTSNKMSLTKFEAEALYSGIVVDTKNFTFKTGVRTFEAASFLRKQGVDTIAVKTIFQQDFESYIKRSEIIKNAKIIKNNIAISVTTSLPDISSAVIAQAADELLNIKGVIASFVICQNNNRVNISGRSLGEINVQLILEKLGGGGHLTIAGAQLENIDADTAKDMLVEAIENYYLDNAN